MIEQVFDNMIVMLIFFRLVIMTHQNLTAGNSFEPP